MARPSAPRPSSPRAHARTSTAAPGRLPTWTLPVVLAVLLLGTWLVLRPKPRPEGGAWAPVVPVRVVNTFPHDPSAFTQGLLVDGGQFVEGTGLNDSSEVRRVDIATGEVRRRVKLDSMYFGEGVALAGQTLYQITWTDSTAFTYDRATLTRRNTFRYDGEGWGLTFDGQHLVMSDGSATLTFRDTADFRALRTVQVTDNGAPVDRLNELEFVNGKVLANIWSGDRVAVIDPATGRVERWLALEGLRAMLPRTPGMDVLNGIAYDAATGKLYATGKRWGIVFELDAAALTAPVPEAP